MCDFFQKLTKYAQRGALKSALRAGLTLTVGMVALQHTPVSAQALLITQAKGSLKVDGLFHEWSGQRAVSFEHHARYALATLSDLRGEMRVAVTSQALYFMLEVYDDDLRLDRAGQDHARLVLTSPPHSAPAWRRELLLDLKPLASGRSPRVLRGRREVSGALAQGLAWWGDEPQGRSRVAISTGKRAHSGAQSGAGGWRVELSVPLSELPPIAGEQIGLMGLLFDVDDGGLESVYSTALSSPELTPLSAGWRLGGNNTYQALYEATHKVKLHAMRREPLDWTGDERPETLVITPSELFVFGAELPSASTAARWSHGWGANAQLERVELKSLKRGQNKTLYIEHTQRSSFEGEPLIERVGELYELTAQGLERTFAQVLEVRWGSRRAGRTLTLKRSGLHLSRLSVEGVSVRELSRLPRVYGREPVEGSGRGGAQARRFKRSQGAWRLSRD